MKVATPLVQQADGKDNPDPCQVKVAYIWPRMEKYFSSDSTAPCQGEGAISVKMNTQTSSLCFIASLGHARKPSQLEERRCSCVFLLGHKLPEQRARARCLIFCSCECRSWNLFFKNKSVNNYYSIPLTYSIPSSLVAARRHRLQQNS